MVTTSLLPHGRLVDRLSRGIKSLLMVIMVKQNIVMANINIHTQNSETFKTILCVQILDIMS